LEPLQTIDTCSDAHGVQLSTYLQPPAQTRGLTGIQDCLESSLGRYPAYQKEDGVGTDVYGCVTPQGYLLVLESEYKDLPHQYIHNININNMNIFFYHE
jgi:hypothetical protein